MKGFLDASMRRDWTQVAELGDAKVELHGGVQEGRIYGGLAGIIHIYDEVDGEVWKERRNESEGPMRLVLRTDRGKISAQ